MASFPSLGTTYPSTPLMEKLVDSVLRSPMDGGYVQTRQRYTRIRKLWDVTYTAITTADKVTLEAFVQTVAGGANQFTWTNPQDGSNYEVRFNPIPNFSYNSYDRWNVTFSLEQV